MAGALILDGHSRAAVEATQVLGRAGISVVVASSEPLATAFLSRYASVQMRQPAPMPAESFLDWLREVDGQHRFQLIVPSTESSLQAFQLLGDDDDLRRRAVLPRRGSLEIALDKRRTTELACRLGIPVPATRWIADLSEAGRPEAFPVVLKPVRSKLASGGELETIEPVIVHDQAAWQSVLEEWLPRTAVLEQEYVAGWGVGIELLYRDGAAAWHFAHERLHEWPLTGGASTYRRAIGPPPAMLAAARRLLDELGWHGVAMVEFKRRRDGSFALLEVNPRLWGSLALSVDAGVNFPRGLWRIAVGEPLPAQPRYRCGLRTRHLASDLEWLKSNFAADHGNPLLLTRPRLESLLEPLLVLCGLEHWDHFCWTDPRPAFAGLGRTLRSLAHSVDHRRQIRTLLRQRRQLIGTAIARLAAAGAGKTPRLLFVCQGNICRSAFAALVARQRLSGFEIESAGFDRRPDRRTPAHVADEARRMAFDMSGCRSTSLTEDQIRRADLILFMDLSHHRQLAAQFPEAVQRAIPLGLLADDPVVEIEDPNHRDAATVRRTMGQISSAIDGLAAALDHSRAASWHAKLR